MFSDFVSLHVPAVYLRTAFLAYFSFPAFCGINNLRPLNGQVRFKSRPPHHTFLEMS